VDPGIVGPEAIQYKIRVGSEYLFTMRKEAETNYKFKKGQQIPQTLQNTEQ